MPRRTLKFKGIFHNFNNSGVDFFSPGYISTDALGFITYLGGQSPPDPIDENIDGYLLPGFNNAHSHAFQYAMAAKSEFRGPGSEADSFWSWRELMYELAAKITPTDLEAIAAQLYAEMLASGYHSVVEFHYLHHQPDGKPYTPAIRMSEALLSAAASAGIQIKLVPVYYRWGGFGSEPSARQRRFISKNVDAYLEFVSDVSSLMVNFPNADWGIGAHSMRAANLQELQLIDQAFVDRDIHIHIAEQPKEVEDCLRTYGARPIEVLAGQVNLDDRWSLVHATHTSHSDRVILATSRCTVVVCPSTEANLGDGVFALRDYQGNLPKLAIGSDSHVCLSPFEELRLLEYSNRLLTGTRNVASGPGEASALNLMTKVLGRQSGFQVGDSLSGIVLKADHPMFLARSARDILSALVFSYDARMLAGSLVRGTWRVKDWRHSSATSIRNAYMTALGNITV